MKKIFIVILFLIFFVLFFSFRKTNINRFNNISEGRKYRIVYLSSYDIDIKSTKIIKDILLKRFNISENYDGSLDNSQSQFALKIFYMNSKKHPEESYLYKISEKIRDDIKSYNPDIILVSDDNAVNYIISRYFKNVDTPVLFCGVNWDITGYGLPAENIAGQIEIEDVGKLIAQMKKYGKGDRIGILTGETYTDRKSVFYYQEEFDENFSHVEFVDNIEDWKEKFLEMQQEVDFLILRGKSGISGWDNDEIKEFVNKNTKIITGNCDIAMRDFSVFSVIRVFEEFGEYLADNTLFVLKGIPPAKIGLSKNRQVKKYVNPILIEKLNIKLSDEDVKSSQLNPENKKKVLYVNSYNNNHDWSSKIYRGILKRFNIKLENGELNTSESAVLLKKVNLDIKQDHSEKEIKKNIENTLDIIGKYKPDIIIASDDYASKYLVKPHLKNSTIPVVFCGVNWTVSEYGYPYKNATGMIEVIPIKRLIEVLENYTAGRKLGILCIDEFSQKKDIEKFRGEQEIDFEKISIVKNFQQWKDSFMNLQKEVDILILMSTQNMPGWNEKEAEEFVLNNTDIITGSFDEYLANLASVNMVKKGEEHGWYSAGVALEVLNGKDISDVPIQKNKNFQIIINRAISNKLRLDHKWLELEYNNIINVKRSKVFYVNSYTDGYIWSDNIFNGILKSFNISKDIITNEMDMRFSKVDFEYAYMNSKKNSREEDIKKVSKEIIRRIKKYSPDIILTSDDNALEYVGLPYSIDNNIPVVFSGINAEPEKYGLPRENITGILERIDFISIYDLLKKYAKGERIGILSTDNISEYFVSDYIKNTLKYKIEKEYYVKDMQSWKNNFLKLQKEVDMIILFSVEGIQDWDVKGMVNFVLINSKIPVGCSMESLMKYSLFGVINNPESHGIKSGDYAIKILRGEPVKKLPIVTSYGVEKYINMEIMKEINILVASEDLEELEIYR